MYREITKCRVCESRSLKYLLSLGEQTVKDFVDDPGDGGVKGPLDLFICEKCGLVQLKHTFSKEYLYTHYWYKSGTSTLMINELKRIVESVRKYVDLKAGDIVVDIGSNDGTLLRQYPDANIIKLGYEPSNIWVNNASDQIEIVNDYFNEESFLERYPGRNAK